MSKSTVTRLFIGSAITVAAGAIVAIAAVWLALANDVFVLSGPDVVGAQASALAWFLLAVGVVGGVAFTAGLIGGLASWIGALLNTSQLESKTWFIILLLLGIFNVGFFAMIAYVIAGPDGTEGHAPRGAQAPASA
jgi:hypothetical protein